MNISSDIARPLNILIVEDNADDIVLLEHAFKKSGFAARLKSVADGMEALAYLNGEGAYGDREDFPIPDFLLLDLNMPRKNGFEVLAWVRANPRFTHLMVHVLSASSRPADVERAYELHANSYTIKPTRLDELVDFVVALQQWHRFVTLARPAPRERHAAAIS